MHKSDKHSEEWILNTEARVSFELSTPVRRQNIAYRKYTSDEVPFLTTLEALIKSGLFQSLEQILERKSLADCPQIPAAHINYLQQMNILVRDSDLGRRPVYQVDLVQNVATPSHLPNDLCWNQDLWVQWGPEMPPAFQPEPPYFKHLSAQRPVIWCRSLAYGCWYPYWAPAELASAVQAQDPAAIQGLSPAIQHNLWAADMLHSKQPARVTLPNLQVQLQQQAYLHLPDLIPPLHLKALQVHARTLAEQGFFHKGDSQVKSRDTIHNEPVLRFLQAQICAQLLRALGLQIQPSYNYLALYHPGAVMPYHTDREQCEWNMSILIDQPEAGPGANWPLHLQTADGPRAMVLNPGGALLYQGAEMPHWRDTLPGEHGVGVGLLHFVGLDYQGSLA